MLLDLADHLVLLPARQQNAAEFMAQRSNNRQRGSERAPEPAPAASHSRSWPSHLSVIRLDLLFLERLAPMPPMMPPPAHKKSGLVEAGSRRAAAGSGGRARRRHLWRWVGCRSPAAACSSTDAAAKRRAAGRTRSLCFLLPARAGMCDDDGRRARCELKGANLYLWWAKLSKRRQSPRGSCCFWRRC